MKCYQIPRGRGQRSPEDDPPMEGKRMTGDRLPHAPEKRRPEGARNRASHPGPAGCRTGKFAGLAANWSWRAVGRIAS